MRIIDKKSGHTIELIYSIDDHSDTGKGYYWQDLNTFKVSQSFKFHSNALKAGLKSKGLKWAWKNTLATSY